MDWELLRERLEKTLNVPVKSAKWSWDDWRRDAQESGAGSLAKGEEVYFFVQKEGQDARLFTVREDAVTPVERRLVELMLEAWNVRDKKSPVTVSELERKAGLVREWFREQQELGLVQAEMPDTLVSQLGLYSTKIPLLLYGDYTTARRVQYLELKKLLESFFDAEITLIPLTDKEWLMLAPENILSIDDKEDRDPDEETQEDLLAAVGYGLHEMLENEWVGECHLAVHYPILPSKELYAAILQLRETMMLGRTYHVGSTTHLPWELQLEKLVHLIPDAEKAGFLERAAQRLDLAFDPETLTTLEHFFQLDCNVSETAKKLYIHRNTLLYRLDRFKQETGLDVRTFNHAVLVKIAMLLYKVTKRK
ncbi:PucR family transcriptional regulator [Paenibacillus sp. JMULE4]|uniref:PucR family transcriptional regulator n=1 Tax=Paenibacillus TaxID=44249 RepID=UPI0008813163|nr:MULTISPECIES: helix-turn-helix domain-containing protein [Paenibacillus]NTZ20519.1 PucR family transcriptional regulator [Paenibacillus sp. JMULE4]SDJ58130.1 PucR C-terminal helix-turn-helix domain-containing protein [Paenibacillus naphthalenovorans]